VCDDSFDPAGGDPLTHFLCKIADATYGRFLLSICTLNTREG